MKAENYLLSLGTKQSKQRNPEHPRWREEHDTRDNHRENTRASSQTDNRQRRRRPLYMYKTGGIEILNKKKCKEGAQLNNQEPTLDSFNTHASLLLPLITALFNEVRLTCSCRIFIQYMCLNARVGMFVQMIYNLAVCENVLAAAAVWLVVPIRSISQFRRRWQPL